MPAASTTRHGKSKAPANGGFHPLRWIRSFLSRPLKLKRIGRQWHVVFDMSRMLAPATSSKSGGRGEALRMAHVALQTLLAEHREARHVMPHLTHLEHSLARQGSRALLELPVKVLQRALAQLDTIEGGRQAEALVPLRLRVEEAVRQRTPVNLRGDIANVEVKEASESQYAEVEDHWTNRMDLDDIYAKAGISVQSATTK
ncbi:MAG TPA: hypothetical protein VFK10_15225 [Burkholderiaceae bacterium]|nr:hypothetical protein [Burkholderiaceae bacterium]